MTEFLKLTLTRLNRPSMNDFAIRQKFGRDVSKTSETALTMARMAIHTGSPDDFADVKSAMVSIYAREYMRQART